MTHLGHAVLRAAIAGAVFIAASCTSISMPWGGDEPASSNATAKGSSAHGERAVMIVGPFANPQQASVSWANIGPSLSESLRQKLQTRRDLDVRADGAIVNAAQLAMQGSADSVKDTLAKIHERHPDVRYIVAGNVAEFSHSRAPGAGAAASRNQNEANVMLDLDIIDLQAQRIIARERIGGSAWASNASASQTYSGVTLGSYRFRETPLGLASRDAIDRAAVCIERAVPLAQEISIRIVSHIEGRRVRLQSDADRLAAAGDVLRVYVYDESGTKLRPVLDPQTSEPLTAKIESRGLYPSAWLQGEWPAGVQMAGAVLRK